MLSQTPCRPQGAVTVGDGQTLEPRPGGLYEADQTGAPSSNVNGTPSESVTTLTSPRWSAPALRQHAAAKRLSPTRSRGMSRRRGVLGWVDFLWATVLSFMRSLHPQEIMIRGLFQLLRRDLRPLSEHAWSLMHDLRIGTAPEWRPLRTDPVK